MTSPKTIIVIPCYNEEKRLETQLFLDFLSKPLAQSILFVNDGSCDRTADVLAKIASTFHEKCQVLNLEKNGGKAEAIRQGFLHGLSQNPQYIGFLDADLAAPLECISELELLLTQTGKHIALGSRVRLLGHRVHRDTLRHFIGRIFATTASLVLNLKVYDTQCGAKLFRATDALSQVFSKPFETRWIFDVEILARFIIIQKEPDRAQAVANLAIEHPLWDWQDRKGSKLKLKDFLTSGMDLLKIARILNNKITSQQ